jgi:hypothetical protein
MVRPAAFDYNPETAATNKMQRAAPAGSTAQGLALREFEAFAQALRSEGVCVCIVDDAPLPPKPDAVFPNNWLSFHEDGTVVLYPMQAQSRRRERRPEIVDSVARELGFKVSRVLDLTKYETRGQFLEGTGSLVLDHVERIAYACASPRTNPAVVDEWANELGYEPLVFEACDSSGAPFYHTNVMLSVCSQVAIVGACTVSADDRDRLIGRLASSGRDIVEIGYDEIQHFAGNMLELASWDEALGDCRVLVMSDAARHALRPEVYARLSAGTDCILPIPVPTIEKLGGGSVRCMLAEVFLPE